MDMPGSAVIGVERGYDKRGWDEIRILRSVQIMDTGWSVKNDALSALMPPLSGFSEPQGMSGFFTFVQ